MVSRSDIGLEIVPESSRKQAERQGRGVREYESESCKPCAAAWVSWRRSFSASQLVVSRARTSHGRHSLLDCRYLYCSTIYTRRSTTQHWWGLLVRLNSLMQMTMASMNVRALYSSEKKIQHGPSLRKHGRDVWLTWPTYQQHNPHDVLGGMILTQFFS